MNPPATIKVMHLVFDLRFVDDDIAEQAGADGWCSKTDLTITIRKGLRPRLLVDTVCHEICHACFFAAGIQNKDLVEEQVCCQLTGPMLCVFSENEGLVNWLRFLLRQNEEP